MREKFAATEDIRSGSPLQSCQYLRACIDEAMRMSPPVLAMLYREAQAGGVRVTTGGGKDHYFPQGTDLGTNIYALHHREDIFPDSWRYSLERWIVDKTTGVSQESVSRAQRAFCPFIIGTRACIGKSFAYKELMITIARLCFMYDMRLVPGSGLGGAGDPGLGSGRHRRGELQFEDKFVGQPAGPRVQFKPRRARE